MATPKSSLSRVKHYTKLVAPFSKTMRVVAGGTIAGGMLLTAPFIWLSPALSGINTTYVLTRAVGFIGWFYLAAILFRFYQRTKLSEYILHAHTFWLAGVIAFPLMEFFSGALKFSSIDSQSSLYLLFQFVIASTWFALWMIGRLLCKGRSQQMITEIQRNSMTWKQLISMNMKSVVFMQFPKASNQRY